MRNWIEKKEEEKKEGKKGIFNDFKKFIKEKNKIKSPVK